VRIGAEHRPDPRRHQHETDDRLWRGRAEQAESSAANSIDNTNATAMRTGNRIAGGQAAAAIALNKPTATTACSAPRRLRSLSVVARITACSTNGASANSTSGPRSPRPIASRPTGLATYAVAATAAGSEAFVSERTSRYVPHVASGSA
jgi:hypothetical protein